jgi:HK97 family phage major capsid protein
LKQYDQLFDAATWIPTDSGSKFSIPSIDDTSVSAVQISQGLQNAQDALSSISAVQFDEGGTWRTGNIKASLELLQDSAVDLEQLFAAAFGIRFARGLGASLVASVKANATVGATAQGDLNSGSPSGASQVGFQDLTALIDSLDSAYAEAPGAGWLMRRSTMNKVGSLLDKNGRPLKLVELRDGGFYLLGWPIRVCPSMDAVGAREEHRLWRSEQDFCPTRRQQFLDPAIR